MVCRKSLPARTAFEHTLPFLFLKPSYSSFYQQIFNFKDKPKFTTGILRRNEKLYFKKRDWEICGDLGAGG